MSLSHPDPAMRRRISSPRSLLALYREGLSPEDLILPDKRDVVEQMKSVEKGEIVYERRKEEITRRWERALSQFQQICTNGIAEAEWAFLGRPAALKSLISSYSSKAAAVAAWGGKNEALQQKAQMAVLRRRQRDADAAAFAAKQQKERDEQEKKIEERKKRLEEEKLEKYEEHLRKKEEKQKLIEAQQKALWDKQAQMQEEMRRADLEKREKQRQNAEKLEQERQKIAYEKEQAFLAKRNNIEQIREELWNYRQEQSANLMNSINMRTLKVQQEKEAQQQEMKRRIQENDRIAQEKILKAEKIKQDRIDKIRSQLEEKEQHVQKNLENFKEDKIEKEQEKKAKNLERSKMATSRFTEMKEGAAKAQDEYYAMYQSKNHLKEELDQKRAKQITEWTTQRLMAQEERKHHSLERRKAAEYHAMLKKLELDQNTAEMQAMLAQRDKIANMNVQNSIRQSALRDLNPKEREKLEKTFHLDAKEDLQTLLDKKYNNPVKSHPFKVPRNNNAMSASQRTVSRSAMRSSLGSFTEAQKQEAKQQIEELVLKHKQEMLEAVEEQQQKEKKRMELFRQTAGGAAMTAVQNDERAADKKFLEQLEQRQKAELKQALFFYKRRFGG